MKFHRHGIESKWKRNGNFDDVGAAGVEGNRRENKEGKKSTMNKKKARKAEDGKYERFMEHWSLKKWKIFGEGIEINIDFQ